MAPPPKEASAAAHVLCLSRGLGAVPVWLASLPALPTRCAYVAPGVGGLRRPGHAEPAVQVLEAAGIRVDRLDPERAAESEVHSLLGRVSLVFVADADLAHLSETVRRCGLQSRLPPLVRAGRLAYAGLGAGAILAGPDLAPFLGGTTVPGLGLVEFVIQPGAAPDTAERYAAMAEAFAGRLQFCPLADDASVWVSGGAWQRRESR